jgi:NitT/TauT family transport system substrate-binding protein
VLARRGQRGRRAADRGRLPVTCNLTLPVACVARAARNRAAGTAAPGFAYE